MKITFKTYKRRDGSLMLYINRSNGVSLGLSPERGFAPYGKNATAGQRNAYDAASRVFALHGRAFTGDLSKHSEGGYCAPVECGGFTLVGTDRGQIGGMPVAGDGAYVIHAGLILACGIAYSETLGEADEDEEAA